jgi:ribosomal protein S17E
MVQLYLPPIDAVGILPTAGQLSDHYPDTFTHFSHFEKNRHAQT